MEPAVTITVADLNVALKTWRETAAVENWPDRDDHEAADRDNAEYLFGLLTAA